jgi:hypothetical protein
VLRASIIVLAVLAGSVLADPATDSAGPVDPVAVVGRYQGKLTWSHCDPPGAKAPIVALTPIDSRLELDVSAARDGLSPIVIAGDAHQLTGTAADVTATLTFSGKKTELVITLESGCTAKGAVKRIGAGIAACDELAALARVEAGCGAVAADARLEDVAAIDAELPAWAKTKGTARQKARAACEVRVAALRPTLVDAACLAVAVDRRRGSADAVARVPRSRGAGQPADELPDDGRAHQGRAARHPAQHPRRGRPHRRRLDLRGTPAVPAPEGSARQADAAARLPLIDSSCN